MKPILPPTNGICTRLKDSGAPCTQPAASSPPVGDPWLSALRSCWRHLTDEEKARRAADDAAWQQRAHDFGRRDPACWSWELPDDPYAPSPERCAIFARMGLEPRMDDGTALSEWQGDRCPLCGKGRPKVLDHDHRIGRSRGWLCAGCNVREGCADDRTDVYARWRARPAAAVLGVSFAYPGGWGPAQVSEPERWVDHRYLPDGAPPDRTPAREWDAAMRAIDESREIAASPGSPLATRSARRAPTSRRAALPEVRGGPAEAQEDNDTGGDVVTLV